MTELWWPEFVCPECRGRLERLEDDFRCAECSLLFTAHGPVIRFLAPHRASQASAFHNQYRTVREHDGHGHRTPSLYQSLPHVPTGRPDSSEWLIREQSFRSLLRVIEEHHWSSARLLDMGAGPGWLSHQLARRGHRPVAVDRYDDLADGLGVCSIYETTFPAVLADFDALPFESGQFDAVVFNASLHYSPNLAGTMSEAARMLAPGGLVVAMDSPLFDRYADGEAMVRQQLEQLKSRFGVSAPICPGIGFLTRDALADVARAFNWTVIFVPTSGPLWWRLRRWWGSRRLDREPAAFGVWVAQ